MSDLTDLQASQSVKIAGAASSGAETNYVNATDNGALHTNLQDSAGAETGVIGNPLVTSTTNGALETTQQDVLTAIEINNNLYSRILPLLNNGNFLKDANFTEIDQSYAGNTATLSYKEDTFEIAKVFVEFLSPTDWNITIERYILDDDGSKLLDDDDTELFLE